MCAERRHTMDQYQIIENLIDLYSPDDEVRLEALLAKKENLTDYQYINLQSYFPRISKIKASRSIGRLFLYICPKVKL